MELAKPNSWPQVQLRAESPDIASSTDDYAARFDGAVGRYLLEVQTRSVMRLARPWLGGTVLDVGGGHAQLCRPMLEAGCQVKVLGTNESCFARPKRFFGECVQCVEGNLLAPPFPEQSFDLVLAIRMLAHIEDYSRFIAGLCRVTRCAIIVDYPDVRSINAIAPILYAWKKKIEGNTRTFRLYRRGALVDSFATNGFGAATTIGQFFWPMVLHRKLGWPAGSKTLEALPRALGLTGIFGSPILLRTVRT